MVLKICLSLLFCLQSWVVLCQDCVHTNLSNQYDILTTASRFENRYKTATDSCYIEVSIRDKSTGKIRFLSSVHCSYSSNWNVRMFDEEYKLCDNVRSHVTGFNEKQKVIDNDFGDIIVGDVNFDGREDIAIKKGWEGNAGPIYTFMLQQKDGSFSESNYLSDTVGFFPIEINRPNKELTTLARANSVEDEKTVYKLIDNGQYQIRSKSIVPHNSLKRN